MSKKIKVALWVVSVCVGVPFTLINVNLILISWGYCYERNFLHNMLYVYEHYNFAELGIAGKTRGTEECPKSPEEIRDQNVPL